MTDYHLVGIDLERPPKIQRMPCIDLFFQLNEEATEDWCKEFNSIVGSPKYPVKVDTASKLFIETWVRKPEEIAAWLEEVKSLVVRGNEAYKKLLLARSVVANADSPGEVKISPEQEKLNGIVASLKYD